MRGMSRLVGVLFAAAVSVHSQRPVNASFAVATTSALQLRVFTSSQSLDVDAYALHIEVFLDAPPRNNASMHVRVCGSSIFRSLPSYNASNLLVLDSGVCNGSVPLTTDCDAYTLDAAVSTRGLYHAVLDVAATADPKGAAPYASEMSYVLLLDFCEFGAQRIAVRGSYTWLYCPGNYICLVDGRFLPMVWLHGAFALLWALVVLVWSTHILLHPATHVSLQRRMLLVPIAEMVYMALTAWNDVSSSDSRLAFLTLGARALSLAVAANELILLSHGAKITRNDLRPLQYAQIATLGLSFGISFTLLSLHTHVSLFDGVSWVFLWMCFFYMILHDVRVTLRTLNVQLVLISGFFVNPQTTPVYIKLRLFLALRIAVLGYCAIVCAVDLGLSLFLPLTMKGLIAAALQLLYLGFCIAIATLFRCRKFHDATFILPAGDGIEGPPPQASPRRVIVQGPADATSLGLSMAKPTLAAGATVRAYVSVLGSLNASQVALGGVFTATLNASLPTVRPSSANLLVMHVCPPNAFGNLASACAINTFASTCETYPLIPDVTKAAYYTGALTLSKVLVPSIDATTGIVFVLDACGVLGLVPPVAPVIVSAFDLAVCDSHSVCFGDATVPLRSFYIALVLLWSACTAAWVANIIYFRETFTMLQRRMLVVPTAEWLYMVMATVSLNQTPKPLLFNATATCRVISLMFAAHETLLIAHGWRITRDDVSVQQSMHYRVVSLVWAATLTIVQTSASISLVIFLMWTVSWALLAYMIWFHSAFNIAILRVQMDLVARAFIAPETTPVYTKLRMFAAFRRYVLLYFMAVVAVDLIVNRLFPAPLLALIPVVQELLYLIFVLGVGYTFRCRHFNPLFYVTFPEDRPAIAPAPLAPARPQAPQPWHEGMGLPTVPSHLLQKKSRAVVVVQSPGDETGLGTSFKPPGESPP
ncbi:hypothetical protein SDRG_16751 [Saprolegnia diclina VS20]|uniref:Intimal thickness related receptor IRP domain-containing protein n=1 Tax=Saprolegnia diclina (strain VS20) TaxID=1156394 RepID=T0R090_SAPDV|nr:hypothetical protein SDRG_16751 [Saprolegnia diclina VS20]EQC25388.1 hypothetical protein SDRG_16751 [Saprolegnia diclina VS20]|eukprot:XP_008621190.1 hypothetical protein SDRG_16751 [Saprolegnia diclina VS20]